MLAPGDNWNIGEAHFDRVDDVPGVQPLIGKHTGDSYNVRMFRNHGYDPFGANAVNKNPFCLAVCDRGKPVNVLAECVNSGRLMSVLFKAPQKVGKTQ